MSYEVIWTPDAEQDLAAVYLVAPDQNAVTVACHKIDQALARRPLTYGVARTSGVNRAAEVPPLGITFEVIEDDKRVFVQTAFLTL